MAPALLKTTILPLAMTLNPIDASVVVLYFVAILALGFFFASRSKNTEQYFVASRSYSGWVLGISMLSTTISSITFLAFPAATFALDWRMAVNYITWPIGALLAISVFIPFFRHGRATTAFEYLEDRYGAVASLYGAISFIVMELLRIGLILYLVALAVSSLTGFAIVPTIIVVGLVIACYTVVGGFEGVVWTDVIQAFVLWLGGILCIGLIIIKLPGGFRQIVEVGAENGKFYLGSMDFNLTERTFWTMFILGVVASIGNFGTSQHVVQRYIAAKSTREARKSAIVGACLSVPTWISFFFIGTALWVYYHVNPDPQVAAMEADKVFPYFILHHFPVGITGLVIAGVFSAAMSSLDSSINGLSTVIVTNIVKKYLAKGRDERFYLNCARMIGCICGAVMIIGALVFNLIPNNESVVNMQTIMFALFGGAFLGLFLVGFLTRRVHNAAVLVALVAATLLNLYFVFNTLGWLPESMQIPIHSYWVSIFVNLFFVIVAYGLSLVWNRQRKDLSGLTVWTTETKEK